MATSELLKMYRAMEEAELAQRVQGAAVKYALYLQASEEGDTPRAAFAEYVLDAPTRQIPEMLLQVVTNGTVLSAISMNYDGTTSSGNVTDTDISYVVEQTWLTVWERVNPSPPVDPEGDPVA